MKINVNGQQVEAYSLVMQRKFAEQIKAGTKKVEFRNYNDYYYSRFMNLDAVKRNEKAGLHWGDEGFEDDFKQVAYIHFHDYNNSWFLNVEIDDIGMFIVDTQDIDEYAPDYPDFEEFRADAIENDKLPEGDRPALFYLAIHKVIATNL